MSVVYIASTIEKEIKEKSLITELINEITKHAKGHNNLIDIYSPARDLKVYKAYLKSGKVRSAILLKLSKQIYIPLVIIKKDSPFGWNMSKYSEEYLERRILKISENIQAKKYVIVKI